MNRMRIWISLLGLSLLAAAPALAQLQSLPVYFSPKGGTGLTLDVDFGRDASNKLAGVPTLNHPTTIGGRAYLGIPFVTLGVGAAAYDPKLTSTKSEVQYMGSAALKVFGGALIPVAVSLQAGVGYLKQGSGTFATKTTNVPVGVGVAINVPTPGASIEPWAAARVHINAVSYNTSSGTQAGVGLSGGVNLGLPIGVGAHVALDWSRFGAKPASPIPALQQKIERLTVGVGIHYTIKLPGLPGLPLVPGV